MKTISLQLLTEARARDAGWCRSCETIVGEGITFTKRCPWCKRATLMPLQRAINDGLLVVETREQTAIELIRDLVETFRDEVMGDNEINGGDAVDAILAWWPRAELFLRFPETKGGDR